MAKKQGMQKPFYKSMTFYGALFLGIEAGLKFATGDYPRIEPFVMGLGVFLTAFGFRRAMK